MMRGLKKGEYDLVNISLIGFDPNTGRSYEECQDEWDRDRKELLARIAVLRWWHVIQHIRCRVDAAKLHLRLGMGDLTP